jgi:hypothetical protein
LIAIHEEGAKHPKAPFLPPTILLSTTFQKRKTGKKGIARPFFVLNVPFLLRDISMKRRAPLPTPQPVFVLKGDNSFG